MIDNKLLAQYRDELHNTTIRPNELQLKYKLTDNELAIIDSSKDITVTFTPPKEEEVNNNSEKITKLKNRLLAKAEEFIDEILVAKDLAILTKAILDIENSYIKTKHIEEDLVTIQDKLRAEGFIIE